MGCIKNISGILLLFLSFGQIYNTYAQDQEKINGLRAGLKGANPVAQFDIWCKIAFEYRNSFPDSTIFYAQKAYSLGQKLDLKKGLAQPLSFLGLGYGIKGDRKASLEHHEQAIKIAFNQKDSSQVGYAYNNLGRLFLEVSDYQRAEQNFTNAVEVFRQLNDQTGLAYAYRSLSEVEVNKKNYQKALDLANQAYRIRLAINDKRAVISSLLETGNIYKAIGERQGAWRHLQEAFDLAAILSDKETQSEVELEMADNKFIDGDIQSAQKFAGSAMEKVMKLKNEPLIMRLLLLSAKINLKAGKIKEASVYLDQAIEMASRNENLAAEKDALEMRIQINELQGTNAGNLLLKSRLDSIKDIIARRDQAKEAERLYFQLLVEKSENENQNLKLQLAKEEVKVARQRARNTLIGLFTLIFVTGSTLLYFFLIRQRKINQKLKEQNEKILQNESDIQAINLRLELRNKELSDLAAEKDSLMGIVAHDLRTPLNHIMGFAQLVERTGALAADQKDFLAQIKKSVNNGNNLIQDILDINHYRVRGNLKRTEILLPEFSTRKKNEFASMAAAKQIDLEVSWEGFPKFNTESDFLNRICDNLISNAIKFSPKGGSASACFKGSEHVLKITISDSGPGFSEEDQKEMFKQFKKLSARPTAGEASNGLGLAIVKSLVDQLNGKIELKSAPGQGAVFMLNIPSLIS